MKNSKKTTSHDEKKTGILWFVQFKLSLELLENLLLLCKRVVNSEKKSNLGFMICIYLIKTNGIIVYV